jgi:hypothetical protein
MAATASAASTTRLTSDFEAALDRAAKAGVTKIQAVCSLVGGEYSELGPRQHWSAIAQKGPLSREIGAARGFTQEDAILDALRNLGVIE